MDKSKIFENIKENIAIENFRETNRKHEKTKRMLQSTLMITMCCVSLTGMVFAKDISTRIYNKYNTGKGIENAINEGYIENVYMEEENSNSTIQNEETGNIIKDTTTKVKVSDLIMDNYSLSMTFEVTLSDEIKDITIANEVMEMNFLDLVVYDENNLVLYALDNPTLEKFSEKNNIVVDKALGSGMNCFVSEKEENTVKVIYNFYTGGEAAFPNCKEIHVDMNKIKISKDVESATGDEEITITGSWNFKVDVPEKMYNRKSVQYIQKSTTNNDFNVESAVLYNTGMEIKMKFKAQDYLSTPEIDSIVSEELEFFWSLEKDDELNTLDIFNYLEYQVRENPKYQELEKQRMEVWKYEKYLTNSKGERFNFSEGPRANGEAGIVDGIMTSTCMFDLTPNDATDEVTLHLEYNGNQADIVLKRVR